MNELQAATSTRATRRTRTQTAKPVITIDSVYLWGFKEPTTPGHMYQLLNLLEPDIGAMPRHLWFSSTDPCFRPSDCGTSVPLVIMHGRAAVSGLALADMLSCGVPVLDLSQRIMQGSPIVGFTFKLYALHPSQPGMVRDHAYALYDMDTRKLRARLCKHDKFGQVRFKIQPNLDRLPSLV